MWIKAQAHLTVLLLINKTMRLFFKIESMTSLGQTCHDTRLTLVTSKLQQTTNHGN